MQRMQIIDRYGGKTVRSQHRLALTGTPIENGVHELWSLFDFLIPGCTR